MKWTTDYLQFSSQSYLSFMYVGFYSMSIEVKCLFFPLLSLHSQVETSEFASSKLQNFVSINYKQKTKTIVYNLSH